MFELCRPKTVWPDYAGPTFLGMQLGRRHSINSLWNVWYCNLNPGKPRRIWPDGHQLIQFIPRDHEGNQHRIPEERVC